MQVYRIPLVIIIVALQSGCASTGTQRLGAAILKAASLEPFGRYTYTTRGELELVSSAAHFSFSFTGPACKIFAAASHPQAHNYLQYEVDGVYQKRVKLSGIAATPITINGDGGRRHEVRVFKATEAHTGALVIHRVEGHGLMSLPQPAAPLIEFIGNSITAGAAADPSEVPCGNGQYHDQHNAYQAYGPRVARALHTNFLMSSVSGIGIYRTWNSEGPSMPDVYEKTDFQPDGTPWNFTLQPQVVSIALGTNDFSDGDGKRTRQPFDSATFVSRYIAFVRLLQTRYPVARIALLSSPMVSGARDQVLRNCLEAVKTQVGKLDTGKHSIALFFFKSMTPRGCGGHPSVEDHALLAEQVVHFYRALLH